MDKKQLVGFVLIFVIVMLWSVINQPTPTDEVVSTTDTTEQITDVAPSTARIKNNVSQAQESNQGNDGVFGTGIDSMPMVENEYILQNEVLKLSLSSKGGTINYVELKNYDQLQDLPDGSEARSPVRLMSDDKNVQNYILNAQGRQISTADLFFSASEVSDKSIILTARGEGGVSFEQKYQLTSDNGYTIDYDISGTGLGSQPVQLVMDNYLDPIEKNRTFEQRYSTIYYRATDKDSDYCSCTGDDREEIKDPVEWFSFSHQFFNASFIADGQSFDNVVASTTVYDESAPDMKLAAVTADLPMQNGTFSMKLYTGPNEYKNLKSFDNKLEEIIPFGRSIFGTINRVVIRPAFNWLSSFISSKGLVIIVLIFIIKMLLYPLTYKMLHSQAKMGALKPQLAGLKEKYKDDAQKQQMETMKVYQEYGVSPMGGCMPMVIQMPIWYALFRFFPASITFRQEPFLWASDLSSYDAFFHLPFSIPGLGAHLSLFTILWAISTVAYSYYNMRHMDMSANPAMKYVQYFMPLMFFFFFNNFASGLTCYMLFSNLINIAQTLITKQLVFDDEKILAQLNLKKAQPKKKSGFQAKLEEAMKQQQKMQEQKNAQKKRRK